MKPAGAAESEIHFHRPMRVNADAEGAENTKCKDGLARRTPLPYGRGSDRSRAREQAVFGLLCALLLASCGYVGGPVPPLANIPTPVADLAALQRGGIIIAQFTIPTRTTENTLMKEPVTLDLRVGPGINPFNADQWAEQATHVPAPPKAKGAARYEIPSAPWTGKEVILAVRSIGANGKMSAWSNFAVVPVVAPLEQPKDVRGESTNGGTRLTWRGSGEHFRVLRKAATEPQYAVIGPDVRQPEFLDTTAAIGTEYGYLVQSYLPQGDNKEAQSDLSVDYKYTRQAPLPAMPTGLLGVPTPNSIELSWDSNTGEETVGYHVYRAAPGADFVKLADVGNIPTYSDRAVEHGKTYRYLVTGVDKQGREGARSAATEIGFP